MTIVATPAAMTTSDRRMACQPQRLKLKLVFVKTVPGRRCSASARPAPRRHSISSNKVLDANTAVKTLAMRPIVSVVANPRMGLVPNWKRKAAAISDVTWVSTIVIQTRSNPALTAARALRAVASSSLMRSKISTFESTPMPMVRISPAMPGSVIVTGMNATSATRISRFSTIETSAFSPVSR